MCKPMGCDMTNNSKVDDARVVSASRLAARGGRVIGKVYLPILQRQIKQAGSALAVEMFYLSSFMLCVAVLAWAPVAAKLVAEWSDVASAVGSLDQTYTHPCGLVYHANDPVHHANNPIAFQASSSFIDNADFCDEGCNCGVVICIPATGPEAHLQ